MHKDEFIDLGEGKGRSCEELLSHVASAYGYEEKRRVEAVSDCDLLEHLGLGVAVFVALGIVVSYF